MSNIRLGISFINSKIQSVQPLRYVCICMNAQVLGKNFYYLIHLVNPSTVLSVPGFIFGHREAKGHNRAGAPDCTSWFG